MEQYINKSVLVAEIDKGINGRNDWHLDEYRKGYHDALTMLKKYLSTLEVKEVDLEEEMDKHWDEWAKADGFHSTEFAKHFFELGMNVKLKGIDTTHNIDAILEEKGIDIESREVKAFKEAFYNAIDTYLPKAQKGE